MKNSKKLKLIFIILICVLISLIGFLGIYLKVGNSYKNILPEYKLSSDLEGSRVLEFEVDTSTETVYFDNDGKKVDSTTITEKNEKDYTKKEILLNEKESLNQENYEKVVKIMKERLVFLQADQYKLDLDGKTGKIVLTFEDEYPDDIKSILPMEGKLEFLDSNTEDVILSYSDFNSAEATYAALEDGSYITYINLKLNDSGIEKINNIDKYKTSIDEDVKEQSEEAEATVNNLKIMFDSDEIAEVSYDDIILTNKTLRIATDKNLTSDSSINSKLNTNTIVSKLATIGKLPVIYNLTAEEYVQNNAADYICYIVIGILAICVVISIYLIIRYKIKGILAVLSFAANIALFLVIIRLTNVQISLNGLAGMIGLIVLNLILLINILVSIKEEDKEFSENVKNAYLKTAEVCVIRLIIFAVFSVAARTDINTKGLVIGWGGVITILGNLILTVPMLSVISKK